ncbi:ATPase [Chlorogloea sp. CCALA 695]|nr:ATPase [Chlorogloea sp. CCALA 695]
MIKRVNQKIAATYSIRNKSRLRASKNLGVVPPRLSVLEQPLESSINRLSQAAPLQKNLIKLMPNRKDFRELGQQINQIVVQSSDPEMMLKQISQAWGEAFAVDCCLVIAVDEALQPHQTGYWSSEELFSSTTLLQFQLIDAILLLPNRTELLAIDDLKTLEIQKSSQGQDLSLPVQSVLSIPTYFQGKQNGLITLWRLYPYQWRDYDLESAQIAAESVAIALAQIAQAKAIASLKRVINTSTQHQNAINELTMASRNTPDLTQILQLAISRTSQSLQVERGLIITLKSSDLLFKNRPKQFIPKAKVTVVSEWNSNSDLGGTTTLNNLNQSVNNSIALNQSFWLSECALCQQAFINAPEPLTLNFNDDFKVFEQSEVNPLFNITSLPAVMMFPLENQGTTFGFLLIQNSTARTWQVEELTLLKLVSVQVSTAIIQNQTLRQVQNLVDERTAQLQGSLEVQSKLYEKTRQQIDQLRQTNKLKDDFIDTISHELRTPLTSMNLAIRMLRTPGISNERKVKYLDILEQQCNQEINLITDLLRLQKLESNQTPLNLQSIKISSKLNDLVEMYTETWSEKGLAITVNLPQKPLLLQTDADSFDRILHELLTNAGKYALYDTSVILQAITQGDRIVISVTNIGAEILPEDATYIFDKFRRGHGVTDQAIKGTGLGLALVKSLVQHLNGTIEVTSIPIEQSSSAQVCFTLTLPQLPVAN